MDKQKLVKHLNKMIDGNYEYIDKGLDDDNNCRQEISTLENILSFINMGMYDKDGK